APLAGAWDSAHGAVVDRDPLAVDRGRSGRAPGAPVPCDPMSDLETRRRQRTMWASGDLPDIATTILDAAEVLVDAADPQPGQDVLDVATGTGNVAIPMAQRGARVVGLDITPELFDDARRRAAGAAVEIE